MTVVDEFFTVTVSDNGVGLASDPEAGLGTTIINAWVRATGGSWSLAEASTGSGCVLTARLRPLFSSRA